MTEKLRSSLPNPVDLIVRKMKDKARSRLAYLLLDVFLGGFIVGVVLLTTLGRPVSIAKASGGGGLPFMVVEYTWTDPDLVLAPILSYQGERLSGVGLSGLWSGGSDQSVWPAYDWKTGEIDVRGPFFRRITVDGFDPRFGGTVRFERDGSFYGRVWLSEPCPGTWGVGLRVVETPSRMNNPDGPIDAAIKVFWDGYSKPQENTSSDFRKLDAQKASAAVVASGSSFAVLTGDDSISNIVIPPAADDSMENCPLAFGP